MALKSISNPIKTDQPLDQFGYVSGPVTPSPALGTVGAFTPTGPTTNPVNPQYSSPYDAMLAAAQSAYNASVGGINQQIAAAPQVYQQYSNQAYVNSLVAERARQESMANMGYAGAGGMSQTLQQRNANALNTNLASIGTARQDYINSLQSDLLTQKASYDQTIAGIEAERADADAAKRSEAFQLYASGIISADQLYQMTGVRPVSRGSGGGGSGPSGTAQSQYHWYLEHGATPQQAADMSGYAPGQVDPNTGYVPNTLPYPTMPVRTTTPARSSGGGGAVRATTY